MSTLFDVSDRLALVTGSSRGLGRSLALALARAGARVIVHGRDAQRRSGSPVARPHRSPST
jgi:gluconate 5-dehydrogenase